MHKKLALVLDKTMPGRSCVALTLLKFLTAVPAGAS